MKRGLAPRAGGRGRLHFSLCLLSLLAAVATPVAPLRAAASAAAPAERVLLVVGDSLSAEYGLARGQGWVALLGQRLAAERPGWRVVNASISGDTTAGGRTRIGPLLAQHRPRIVIVELGGNDALRGLPLTSSRENLDAITVAAQNAGARVLIAGIQMPPNYGRQYMQDFAALYADTAKQHRTALLPFILAGIADRPDADAWFQADRIHPLAKAHPIIVEHVWPVLAPMLER